MSKRAVFFDRDGTLIEHYDYITDPSQVQLLASTVPALKLLRERGFLLVVVSNQSAVARGMITEKQLHQINDQLQSLLAGQGVTLDKVYYDIRQSQDNRIRFFCSHVRSYYCGYLPKDVYASTAGIKKLKI